MNFEAFFLRYLLVGSSRFFYADEEDDEAWNLPDRQDLSANLNGTLFERNWKQLEEEDYDIDAYSPDIVPKRGSGNFPVSYTRGTSVDLVSQPSKSVSQSQITRSVSAPMHSSAHQPITHQRSFNFPRDKLIRVLSAPHGDVDRRMLKGENFSVPQTPLYRQMSDRSLRNRSQADVPGHGKMLRRQASEQQFVRVPPRLQRQNSLSATQMSEKRGPFFILLLY